MGGRIFEKQVSSFQIVILGFAAVILLGTGLLTLPAASRAGGWTSIEDALFTATSAVCVTGLVVKDTAIYWSFFGQAVILLLIQIGGLGIVTTLKTHDYRYLTAKNGAEAILMAASHNPDVLFLDLGLPDMDGIDVIRQVRTWSNRPSSSSAPGATTGTRSKPWTRGRTTISPGPSPWRSCWPGCG